MTAEDEKKAEAVTEAEAAEEEIESELEVSSLKILAVTHDLHQKHGLRHGDYQRYRGYCARRIARIRKAIKMVQGEKKKFNKKDVDNAAVEKDTRALQIPLMTVERAWAYAMQLKFEMNSEPRKRFHMINRLRKAAKESERLDGLVQSSGERCDARSKLETTAYAAWIRGTLRFELQQWKEAAAELTAARSIYEKLSSTLGEEEAALYKVRMSEIVPNLRFCAYNSGDEVAKQELLSMRGGGGASNVDELINQAKQEQASTLQEVEWRGRKMAVRQEQVRLFLLREQEFESGELENARAEAKGKESGAEAHEAVVEAYESLLMDCKDAVQALKSDLAEDPAFRNRQQVSEGAVSASHFLHTYLSFIKCSRTVERSLSMITNMTEALEAGTAVGGDTKKKPVRAQDLVRLYETVMQNLNEMPQLAGLEEDLAFRQEIEAKTVYYKACRCFFIAQAFMAARRWPEAMAMFQRATTYAVKAKGDKILQQDLKEDAKKLAESVESKQFMAHANSIIDDESKGKGKGGIVDEMTSEDEKKALFDRLELYYEDPKLSKGKPNLADFPPSFKPIPCKPLFFDLAREQLNFPNLEAKLASPSKGKNAGTAGGASGGWLGGWLGGWGGGEKK